MGEIKFDQLMADLKKKIYYPVYLFTGDEPYYIDIATSYIMDNVLINEEKSFNQIVFYGKDSDTNSIIDAARRYPMMSNHQVIILKEAQELRSIENLAVYIEKPLKSTILVINFKEFNNKTLDKRKKLYQYSTKTGVVLVTKKLYNDKIPDWIIRQLENLGISTDYKAATMLGEFLGNDLSRINKELEKLIITLPTHEKFISAAHVEKNIGISKEYNNFELHHALAVKDVLKANRIINYFAENQKNNHISVTLSSLFMFFSKVLIYNTLKDKSRKNVSIALKVNPYFVTEYERAAKNYSLSKTIEIISFLREYDMRSKGYYSPSIEAGELLKELIFKILH